MSNNRNGDNKGNGNHNPGRSPRDAAAGAATGWVAQKARKLRWLVPITALASTFQAAPQLMPGSPGLPEPVMNIISMITRLHLEQWIRIAANMTTLTYWFRKENGKRFVKETTMSAISAIAHFFKVELAIFERAKGREEGHAKGHAEGREEGRTEERHRINALLDDNKVNLPPDVRDQLLTDDAPTADR